MIEVLYSRKFYSEAVLYKINEEYRWCDYRRNWTKSEVQEHQKEDAKLLLSNYIKIFEIME